MDVNDDVKLYDRFFRQALYEAHNGECFYTGRKVIFDKLHVDHIVPKSVGGKDVFSNLVLTSQSINMMKSDSVDMLKAERMIYLNSILFCPSVIKKYDELKRKKEYENFKNKINVNKKIISKKINSSIFVLDIEKELYDKYLEVCSKYSIWDKRRIAQMIEELC